MIYRRALENRIVGGGGGFASSGEEDHRFGIRLALRLAEQNGISGVVLRNH
ncbi:hypothetical protein [Natrinema halophilum]|uniref:Uncharacterized protein n=1 Tax=Natrinema halophilum TaxID=1699371 RepID=A0A7D5KBN0_9EURY|nr:hypothetical protein [Natrinema halophilum]QLG47956.1 hypothetical protein HYG82_03400 [Natrinema halophilum]